MQAAMKFLILLILNAENSFRKTDTVTHLPATKYKINLEMRNKSSADTELRNNGKNKYRSNFFLLIKTTENSTNTSAIIYMYVNGILHTDIHFL